MWLPVVIICTVVVFLIGPLCAAAQSPRIGYLSDDKPGPESSQTRFEEGLREYGYVPGINVVVEKRGAERRPERLPALAAELVRLHPDLIVATSERGAVAARQATGTIPIVVVAGIDLIGQGLVASLARPGGNVTGLTMDAGPEIIAKRLQILRELVPKARTIALLTEPGPSTARFRPLEEFARSSGTSIVRVDVGRSEDLAPAFVTITKAHADAVLVSGGALLYLLRRDISGLAYKHRLPSIYGFRDYVEAGGLSSYGIDVQDVFRRAGGYAGRILKGAKPAELPVEQPTKFEFAINRKTATAFGLVIPSALLLQADAVVD